MKKAELIKGIDLVLEGLTTIKSVLSAEDVIKSALATAPESTPEAVVSDGVHAVSSSDSYSRAELEKMPYNKFKTFAAKLGVKCTGTREEIMDRIVRLGVVSDGETSVPKVAESEDTVSSVKRGRMSKKTEPVSTEIPADKSDKPVGGKRGLVKKAAESAGDKYDEQAKIIAEDTPVEEIIDALAEVNIKATKKNFVEKLAHALRKGLIEPEEDSEEDVEEPETEDGGATPVGDDDGEEDNTSYHAEFDPDGFNDPSSMTEDRRDAIENLVDEIQTDFSEGRLTTDQMVKFLENNCTQEELDLLEDSDDEDALLAFYIEIMKRFVDDEGEKHDPEDPYEVGGKNMCCGHLLKYVPKTKNYVCETCGGEYEAEE